MNPLIEGGISFKVEKARALLYGEAFVVLESAHGSWLKVSLAHWCCGLTALKQSIDLVWKTRHRGLLNVVGV